MIDIITGMGECHLDSAALACLYQPDFSLKILQMLSTWVGGVVAQLPRLNVTSRVSITFIVTALLQMSLSRKSNTKLPHRLVNESATSVAVCSIKLDLHAMVRVDQQSRVYTVLIPRAHE